MPSQLAQSSPALVQTASGNPLPAPTSDGVFALTVPDGVTGDLDWTSTTGRAFRVLRVWAQKTDGTAAASANTLQLQRSDGTPISDALNMQVAANTIVKAASIDPAQQDLASNQGLRVRRVKVGQDAAAVVYVKIALR